MAGHHSPFSQAGLATTESPSQLPQHHEKEKTPDGERQPASPTELNPEEGTDETFECQMCNPGDDQWGVFMAKVQGEKSGGEENPDPSSEDVAETGGEGAQPRFPTTTRKPTLEEWEEHRKTHIRFRSWCPICIASRGKDLPHRSIDRTADEREHLQDADRACAPWQGLRP